MDKHRKSLVRVVMVIATIAVAVWAAVIGYRYINTPNYVFSPSQIMGTPQNCILRRRTAAGAVTNGRRAV